MPRLAAEGVSSTAWTSAAGTATATRFAASPSGVRMRIPSSSIASTAQGSTSPLRRNATAGKSAACPSTDDSPGARRACAARAALSTSASTTWIVRRTSSTSRGSVPSLAVTLSRTGVPIRPRRRFITVSSSSPFVSTYRDPFSGATAMIRSPG